MRRDASVTCCTGFKSQGLRDSTMGMKAKMELLNLYVDQLQKYWHTCATYIPVRKHYCFKKNSFLKRKLSHFSTVNRFFFFLFQGVDGNNSRVEPWRKMWK